MSFGGYMDNKKYGRAFMLGDKMIWSTYLAVLLVIGSGVVESR